MKRFAIALCAAILLTSTSGIAQVKQVKWIPVDSVTAMQKMIEVGMPGMQHALLAKSDGEWDAEMKMWMSPGSLPMITKSICSNKMIFDGRYQQSTFKGDFGGMPFEGISITGYDNAEKVYFSTWMDNMSTGMMTMKGKWNATKNSLTLKGKMICPANGLECEMREVYKIVDEDTHIMEMYGPDMKTGKEYKNMEIKFTRKK